MIQAAVAERMTCSDQAEKNGEVDKHQGAYGLCAWYGNSWDLINLERGRHCSK